MSASSGQPAVPRLHVGDRSLAMHPGETVLEALERAGVDAASGCRAGTCCKCMLRADDPPAESQRSLRPTLRSQGYFLACQARPTGDLTIDRGEAPEPVTATVVAVNRVAVDVVQVLLRPHREVSFRPGQYLDVLHPAGESRSYSIASLPSEGDIELHVRLVPGGLVSGWIHSWVGGEDVSLRGGYGQCFFTGEDEDANAESAPERLLLVGAGTGLAPLLGIARDAISQSYTGRIDLVHGGLDPTRLYLRDELKALERDAAGLRVHHCVLNGATDDEHEGPLDEVAIRLAGPLGKTRAFLCGDGGIVQLLQRSLFLAGVPSGEILADPFLPAPARA